MFNLISGAAAWRQARNIVTWCYPAASRPGYACHSEEFPVKKHKKGVAGHAAQPDIYQLVTDRILASLAQGVLPWRKPWRTDGRGQTGLPVNALTGRHYSGVNVLLLWMAAETGGYPGDAWLTYRQAQEAGGQVRRGETSSLAVVYKDWTRPAEDENGNRLYDADGQPLKETVPMLRQLHLFNVAQCDGLPAQMLPADGGGRPVEEYATVSPQQLAAVQTMLTASGVQLTSLYQDRAYYTPAADRIVMPLTSQFDSEADYWSTLLHEMVHSTGHRSRLDRPGISTPRQKGDAVYALEELVAETGSAFLCAQLGIYGEVQHERYIDGWLRVLKADKKALFRACSKAREATEYLLGPLNLRPVA
ncbi:DNA primase [Salmonella enterica subsp. enterica serovar Newport]|nr:DNA primase [Salmonella enterica subsp. enterica serovar Newport]